MAIAKTMEAIRVLKAFRPTPDGQPTRALCAALRDRACSVADAVALLHSRETHQTDEVKP